MPELSRFYGIRIWLHTREHPPAHFHAKYAEYEAAFDMETLQLRDGRLPPRARSLVVEWAALHREELMEAWLALRQGRMPEKIAPLD
jgi:hypothetical protein